MKKILKYTLSGLIALSLVWFADLFEFDATIVASNEVISNFDSVRLIDDTYTTHNAALPLAAIATVISGVSKVKGAYDTVKGWFGSKKKTGFTTPISESGSLYKMFKPAIIEATNAAYNGGNWIEDKMTEIFTKAAEVGFTPEQVTSIMQSTGIPLPTEAPTPPKPPKSPIEEEIEKMQNKNTNTAGGGFDLMSLLPMALIGTLLFMLFGGNRGAKTKRKLR